MNNRSLVLVVLGVCAVVTTSGCKLDTDIGASTEGAGGHSTGDGCSSDGAGGFSEGGFSEGGGSGEGGFGMGGSGGTGEGGASQLFMCGDTECNVATTFCRVILPPLPDSEPSYECKPIPEECLADPTCECVDPFVCADLCGVGVECGQSCSEEILDGSITGSCALP